MDNIQQQARGSLAQQQIADLLRGPQMQRAQKMQDFQMRPLSGGGFATPTPTAFDAFAQMAQNYRGQQKSKQIMDQVSALRGDAQAGLEAELASKESTSNDKFAQDWMMQQARLDAQKSRDEAKYAREDEEREIVPMKSPTGETLNVQIDRKGDGYLMGNKIDDFDKWTSGKPTGMKPTGGQVQKYREAIRLQGEAQSLMGQLKSMPEEAYAELDSPIADTAISVLPNALERIGEEWYYDTPEAKSYKTQASRFTSKLSQLASGMQVTGYEMKDREKWSPHAVGINAAERMRRMQNIERDIFGQVQTYERMFPDYTMDKMSGNEQPYTPPNVQNQMENALNNLPQESPLVAKQNRLAELRAKKAQANK